MSVENKKSPLSVYSTRFRFKYRRDLLVGIRIRRPPFITRREPLIPRRSTRNPAGIRILCRKDNKRRYSDAGRAYILDSSYLLLPTGYLLKVLYISYINDYFRRLTISYRKSGLVDVKNALRKVLVFEEEVGKGGKVGLDDGIARTVEPACLDLPTPNTLYNRVSVS